MRRGRSHLIRAAQPVDRQSSPLVLATPLLFAPGSNPGPRVDPQVASDHWSVRYG
jgi:hypothetical protein